MSKAEPAPLSSFIKGEPHASLAAFFSDIAEQCALFGADASDPFAMVMVEAVRLHIVAAGIAVAAHAEQESKKGKS